MVIEDSRQMNIHSMTGKIESGNLSKSGKRKCHNQLLHQLQRSMPHFNFLLWKFQLYSIHN